MPNLTKIEQIQKMRRDAPKPFGLYSATCIGLDGGLGYYLQNFQDSNFIDFSAGLKVYRNSDYFPKRVRSKVIKTKGRVKLLEYGKTGKPILLVPSLINKYYIFDLYEDNSFVQHLKQSGFRPFIIDWGEPKDKQNSINLEQIIEDYILAFSDFLVDYTQEKIHLLGYCMGATLALIAACKKQELYKSLSLIALPFDFSEMPFTGMMQAYKDFYKVYLKNNNVSVEAIQTLFFMKDSMAVIERIKNLAKITDKNHLKRMISLEDWLSDCIEFENVIAIDCLDLWYSQNQLYHHGLDLSKFKLPCNLITAEKDEIVPQKASIGIIEHVDNVNHIQVESGHIGIIIGRKSKQQCYDKIISSLLSLN